LTDPDEQVKYLNSIIISVFQENIPLKRCPVKNLKNPWMTPEISRLIVERDIAYNIWDKNKSNLFVAPGNRERFIQLRKKKTKAVRASKRRISSGQLDPKLPPNHSGGILKA
jgi:hypothetical protein